MKHFTLKRYHKFKKKLHLKVEYEKFFNNFQKTY